MQGNTKIGAEAKQGLARGVKAAADAVRLTLGAAGANALIGRMENPGHVITNDGISILEAMRLEDPVENYGLGLVKEVSSRSNKESGDGTTTAAVLTDAIVEEGMKVQDVSPMELKRSLDACLPLIQQSLDAQKKDITPEEVGAVATISAEDEKLGALLQEIYMQIGKDGIVELDNSGSFDTFYELQQGVRLRNAGLVSPYMAGPDEHGNLNKQATFKNPVVLIARQKISAITDLDHIFSGLHKDGIKELVLFCDEIEPKVIGDIVYAQAAGVFKTAVIKAPALWKDWLFEDFAKMTGATIIDPAMGTSFKKFSQSYLGTCERIIVGRDETTVIGIKDISDHVKQLQEEGKENDQLLLRATWLSTKVAVLKIGANSESELSYKRLKAEDARNASYLALQDGVVAGGGVALFNALQALPDTAGGRVLKQALAKPLLQIVENAGVVLSKEDKVGDTFGFDAKERKVVDMWEAQIIDPARVVKNAVRNALSVAGTVLTCNVVVIHNSK